MRFGSPIARGALVAGSAMMMIAGLAVPASAQESGTDVAAVLEAAGLDTDLLPPGLIERVNRRIDKMIEVGVLTEEQVTHIEDLRESGELDDRIAERIEQKRDDRSNHRLVLIDRLAEIGVEVQEGQSVRDALVEAGYEKADAKDLIKRIRPRHHDDDDAGDDDGPGGSDDSRSVDDQIDGIIDRALRPDNRGPGNESDRGDDPQHQRRTQRRTENQRRHGPGADDGSDDTSPTSVPTASAPRTSAPTTSVPSTSVPSTDVPSTDVPMTSVPTTIVTTTQVTVPESA